MSKHKVLVVDNSPVILKIVSNILEKSGCQVRTAGDGLEALDLLTEFHPDIIFTDLVMPHIDGAKLSHIIRSTPAYKDIFLVVLSGIALEDDMNILELGADVCIAKGPASTMKEHILAAVKRFESGLRGSTTIEGLQGLYPREVTSELLINKRHNEIVFERMQEGVFELDGKGRIVRVNTSCCKMFDLPETKILGTNFGVLLPENNRDDVFKWMKELSPAMKSPFLQFDYEHPVVIDGRQVTFTLVPLFEDDQLCVIGLLRDVTERKQMDEKRQQLEKELQRIHKLDAMATMASGIAHDFNNLFTIINGNVEMAKVISKDDEVNHLLSETAKALGLTTRLIRQFSTFSDNYLPSKSRVCVDKLLSDLLHNQLADTSIAFHLTAESDVQCVDLDPDLMLQVFHNIILNAVEAMDGKGTLSVQLNHVDGALEAERIGQLMPEGDLIRISIQDSGPGVDPQILDQIFDPYFSTKQKGTQKGMGLGLTIAHAIVKKHGGLVRFESTPGTGSTVWIYLPANRLEHFDVTMGSVRVLILDDDEMMRIITQRMFEHFNCEVTTVDNGEEAVRVFAEGRRQGNAYDLILLDLRIDNGMNGVDAAAEICALAPQTMMVAMSGDNRDEVMMQFKKYHFVAAVAKPFSIDAVEDVLNIYARHVTRS